MKKILLLLVSLLLGTSTALAEKPANTRPSGLGFTDIEVGDGTAAKKGDNVKVHYTGWLYKDNKKGSKFDSSHDRNTPFTFPLGQRRVIQGWEEGVQGMKIGGKRLLYIPPHLGYGERGAPPAIPPNSWLLFEIELLDTK